MITPHDRKGRSLSVLPYVTLNSQTHALIALCPILMTSTLNVQFTYSYLSTCNIKPHSFKKDALVGIEPISCPQRFQRPYRSTNALLSTLHKQGAYFPKATSSCAAILSKSGAAFGTKKKAHFPLLWPSLGEHIILHRTKAKNSKQGKTKEVIM